VKNSSREIQLTSSSTKEQSIAHYLNVKKGRRGGDSLNLQIWNGWIETGRM